MKFSYFLLALIVPFLTINASEVPSVQEPVVILGGGIGSLTSAIYIGRAGISPLVIEGPMPGGLLTQSHSVQNWPGELEIKGWELTEKIRSQASANGARFLNEEVIGVDFSQKPFLIFTRSLDGKKEIRQLATESCIIAMGTKPNFLNIPGEQEYWGKGVTNCAVCDGSLYKDKVVAVVGGGDAAVLEALYLAKIAKEVHVFVRKSTFKAIEEKRIAQLKEKPNVHFHFNTVVDAIHGDGKNVTSLVLQSGKEESDPFAIDGVFLAIGSKPNSGVFQGQLELDDFGYIVLKNSQETSVEGVYAIGDIVDPVYKQAISAAGDGAKAALQSLEFISDSIPQTTVVKNEIIEKSLLREVIEVASLAHFEQEITNSEIPIILDFYATWCGPCKSISPTIEQSANQLAGKVKFLKVNVDDFSDISSQYNIRAMPTVILLDKKGNEMDRKVGADEITVLLDQLQIE